MKKGEKQFYEFGNFRVDVTERRLLLNGQPIPLPPKAFEMLLTLVQNSGHLLTREELLKTIWTDTFVDENNLRQYVSLLRKTLNGNGQEFIETVPHSGYRFLAEVREVLEDESLPVENQPESSPIAKETEANWRKMTLILSILLIAVLVSAIALALNKTWKDKNQPPPMVGTTNAEAYENYQKGRSLWQTRSPQDLHKAMLLLENSVARDSDFALAHAALADAYAFDYQNWRKTTDIANKAIRLNPNLGEPHASIGFIKMFWEWKLKEAEEEFKQAVNLSPNYATAHQWYAVNLMTTNHTDAALVEMKRALELEPNSISINADLCQLLYFKYKFDEAIAQCQKTLFMDANFINAYLYLYEIYLAKEMYAEAVNTYFKIEELTNFNPLPKGSEKLREAYTKSGIREFWRRQTEILSRPMPQYYKLAQAYARLGETDKTLYWLEKAHQHRDFDFIFFLADPVFNNLRQNQRFKELAPLIF